MSDTQGFELAEPADLLRQIVVGLPIGLRCEIDNALPTGVANKLTVEPRPALGLDLAVQAATDVTIGARTELLRDKILRPRPHAFADAASGPNMRAFSPSRVTPSRCR